MTRRPTDAEWIREMRKHPEWTLAVGDGTLADMIHTLSRLASVMTDPCREKLMNVVRILQDEYNHRYRHKRPVIIEAAHFTVRLPLDQE
jgi:hypothetical protein